MKNHKESFKRNNYGKKSGKKQKHIKKKDRSKKSKKQKITIVERNSGGTDRENCKKIRKF